MEWPALQPVLTDIAKQFPALVLCYFAVRQVSRYLGDRQRQETEDLKTQRDRTIALLQAEHKVALEEIRKDHELALRTITEQNEKHLASVGKAHEAHLSSKDEEVRRLTESLANMEKERDRLLKRIVPESRP
ncbi:MAG: hypothetical protein K2X87_00670 [Gemmataceae bacterium]|nr:hypothetical protein [Gemmataceae bacterium]